MEIDSGSYRDPSGFVFRSGGTLYRQVNRVYREEYDLLLSSGLYARLAEAGLIVRHTEDPPGVPRTPDAYRVVCPVQVPFISYPSEWSFSQLKDAALLTLQIHRTALQSGMTLKDASAYNVQFLEGRPVLIDTLSFERLDPQAPWVAYRQFCEHFLAPLALMSAVDPRGGLLFRSFPEGIPLDLAASLIPRRRLLRPSLFLHLLLHARSQRRFADAGAPARRTMPLTAMLGLADSLESAVRSLRWVPPGAGWNSYYETCSYGGEGFREKMSIVDRIVGRLAPATVWDLGANTGEFSRIAARRGAFTVALDSDIASVEQLYKTCRKEGETRILPLVADIVDPSPGVGWANAERPPLLQRGSPDLVFALALVHHLAIARNVPFGMIADLFARLSPHLLVEFVPKQDPQVQRLLRSRKDVFPSYHREAFESAFGRHFSVTEEFPIPESERILYLMTRRA